MKCLLAILLVTASTPLFAQAGGVETRAQAEARGLALFQRLDANGDGVVTRDEMAQFAAARTGATPIAGAPLPPGAAAMFDDADADHDGKITRAEAIAGALRGFDEADKDHDGKVTPAERAAAVARVTAAIAPTPGDATPPSPGEATPPAPREASGPPVPPQ